MTSALGQRLRNPLLWASIQTRIAIALGIVFLMTVKPDLGGALLTVGVSVALGLALAWRAQRAIVRWLGVIGAGLLATLGAFVAGVALFGFYRLNVPPARPIPSLQVDRSPEQLARGEQLAYLCVGCHSSSGKLP